jgi:hypothetical protein
MRAGKLVCFAVLLLGRAAGAADSQQPVSCGSCHQAQASAQPLTPMGQAMQLAGSNAVLEKRPKLTFRDGAYTYTIATMDGKSVYTVSDGKQSISLPVVWSMGAGAQTWVLERDGTMYESAVSYYPSLDGLSITTGHEELRPKTLEEAIGKPLSEAIARECFNCHATGAVVDHRLDLASLKPGVRCEHCHVGASEHLAGVLKGDLSSRPAQLGKMTSENLSNFCGQCHRTWELVVRSRWSGVANVRFQPYRLANSRCFNGTDPRISCVACHDPHQPLEKSASYYDGKCLACHAPTLAAATTDVAAGATTGQPHAKSCPVAKANCTSCHMPKVQVTAGHLEFTDHEIRVVRPGEAYPN